MTTSRALLPAVLLVSLLHGAPARAWVAEAGPGVRLTLVAAGPSGTVCVAGSRVTAAGDQMYVARYDRLGRRTWESATGAGHAALPAEARSLGVDARGDVFVAGRGPGGSFLVRRLAAASGRPVWETALPGPRGAPEGTASTLVCSSGVLLVGGGFQGEQAAFAVVARLDPRTGIVRWLWQTPGGEIRALAARGTRVAIAGDFLAGCLDAASGRLSWRVARSPRTPAERFPLARTVSLDAAGNVVVGGMLRDTWSDTRCFYMACLAARDGDTAWEYSGAPETGFATSTRVAAVGVGTFAAGRLNSQPAALLVRKDGALGWQARPWESGSESDTSSGVTDLALDAGALYVSGGGDRRRFLVTSHSRSGQRRWAADLGPGEAAALSRGAGRLLFVVGRVGPEGPTPRSIVAALDASSGSREAW